MAVYTLSLWMRYYAQKFTVYAMLECFKLCSIMLLVRPFMLMQQINQLIEVC